MPSHTETFGLTYAEAMSQGLPVIYTRGQGFDKQFDDGVVGYSVSDTNVQELVQKIMECIKHYEKLSTNCVTNVTKFDWNYICNTYISIYEKMIKESYEKRCD